LRLPQAHRAEFVRPKKLQYPIVAALASASLRDFRVDRARSGLSAMARWRGRLGAAAKSGGPSRLSPKNKVDRAIPDRSRKHAYSGPPIPRTRAVTRNRPVAPKRIVTPLDLPRDARNPLVARQKEIDKNPGPRPAESPPAADQSSAGEFAREAADHTIPV